MNPLILPLFEIAKQVLGGLGLDPEAKARAQQQAFELLTQGDFDQRAQQAIALAQIDVNKGDAASGSNWRGGWRPAIGWCGAVGLAYQWLIVPAVTFTYTTWTGHALPVQPPEVDPNLFLLLGSLLGVNIGARSLERIKGKT